MTVAVIEVVSGLVSSRHNCTVSGHEVVVIRSHHRVPVVMQAEVAGSGRPYDVVQKGYRPSLAIATEAIDPCATTCDGVVLNREKGAAICCVVGATEIHSTSVAVQQVLTNHILRATSRVVARRLDSP